jgi:ribonucleotide monophosphatase NagD (HAD superfamily)
MLYFVTCGVVCITVSRPFEACSQSFRGLSRWLVGIILLLTNSPRPKASVEIQLDEIGVARDLYHEVATSGDSARSALASGYFGTEIFHIGPERDASFFASNDIPDLAKITRVPLDRAQSIVCTGLFDDQTETPEDYADDFS